LICPAGNHLLSLTCLLTDESQTNGHYYTASAQDRQALCILVTAA